MISFANINHLKGNSAAGIHLNILPGGEWITHVVLLEKNKNLIHTTAKYEDVLTLDELMNYVPVSLPVILSIEGKGVIHRKIFTANKTLPVLQVFPNAKSTDFWVQSQAIDNDQLIISIIRRETIEEIMDTFKKRGFFLYNTILGPFALDYIWTLFDILHKEYDLQSYNITVDDNVISNLELIPCSSEVQSFSVCNEEIESTLLIPYSNAISFYTNEHFKLSFSEDISRLNREEFIYKRVFQFSAAFLPVLLFLILLINYLFFDRFNNDYEQSNFKYKSGLELVNRLDKIKNELDIKEVLIEENGLLADSKFSFYADRIAFLLPPQIILNSLEINPALSKPKPDKEILIKQNSIKVKGKCLYSLILDEWMETLKKETWIERMEIIQYQQENKGTPGEFIIQIDF